MRDLSIVTENRLPSNSEQSAAERRASGCSLAMSSRNLRVARLYRVSFDCSISLFFCARSGSVRGIRIRCRPSRSYSGGAQREYGQADTCCFHSYSGLNSIFMYLPDSKARDLIALNFGASAHPRPFCGFESRGLPFGRLARPPLDSSQGAPAEVWEDAAATSLPAADDH